MVLLLLAAALPLPAYAAAVCSFGRIRCQPSLRNAAIAFSRRGVSPFKRVLQARFSSDIANGDIDTQVPSKGSEIIFLGTGTSEGIPRVSCLTNPLKTCMVCPKANEPGNKNRRLNTSILIHYHNSLGRSNILVDAGKCELISLIGTCVGFSTTALFGGFLCLGLDDLRDWTNNVQSHIPIYVAKRDFEITPLPVWHGKGYRSLGFRFGNVCYISDASEIPEETYALLKDCEILILDALRPDRSSSTHFGLPRALEEVRKIKPRRALFTGMMHLMDHDKVNEDLAKLMETEGLDVQLSYDGLRIPFGSMRSF
ncbi:putative hydrolase C777.06c isoform X8 [Magnolia sinica]|uniref:putative hydrolase C777.06c isoform X8 n=1 Tax=Magnolia sinica TaxID=86752 RepID=UPI002659495F|nr:putative hydrolase C777.06c isoform X8 [Magnolia sinica]